MTSSDACSDRQSMFFFIWMPCKSDLSRVAKVGVDKGKFEPYSPLPILTKCTPFQVEREIFIPENEAK